MTDSPAGSFYVTTRSDARSIKADAHAADSVVTPQFLSALEDGHSVDPSTGWQPYHLEAVEKTADGETSVGYLPLYLKGHSWGEYIFDWSWADAAKSFAVEYYPKLISMSPFTPISAPKLNAGDQGKIALASGLKQVAEKTGVSSAHVLFISQQEAELFKDIGFFIRETNQFHWNDPGFGDFEGFLASFNHKHRKNVRQERRKVDQSGVRFEWLRGREIKEADWDYFYQCYLATTSHYGAIPYIERNSYSLLSERLGDKILLLRAYRGANPVASAFFIQSGNGLCGRYWGATEYIHNLHFETCYYQPIEFCLNHGIPHFEAGAQGEHKIWRGLTPATIYSAHYAVNPTFNRAISSHSRLENDYHRQYKHNALRHSPYKNPPENEL